MYVTLCVCAALSLAGALVVSIPKDRYEFARGDNITLPCLFKPKVAQPSIAIVIWTADGGEANVPEVGALMYQR